MSCVFNAIVAMDERGAIGLDNKLPWHVPEDFRYFKRMTMGHALLMGRKSFESLGKPLPGRFHFVMSRSKLDLPEGAEQVSGLSEAIEKSKACEKEKLFLCGGAQLYQMYLEKVDRLYLTRIHTAVEADTFFPALDFSQWDLEKNDFFPKGESSPFNLHFQVWKNQRF